MCHCVDWQRRTGTLFSIVALFEHGAVSILDGRSRIFTRHSVVRRLLTFHFSSGCGSTVFGKSKAHATAYRASEARADRNRRVTEAADTASDFSIEDRGRQFGMLSNQHDPR
jgi:hypothetical protein